MRQRLFQKLDPFRFQFGECDGQTGHIATRTRQALRPTLDYRIAAGDSHDGNRVGGLAERFEGTWTACQENINLQSHEFRSECGEAIRPAVGVSVFESDVSSGDIAEVVQPFYKAARRRVVRRRATDEQDPDARHVHGRLSQKLRTTEDQRDQDGKTEEDTSGPHCRWSDARRDASAALDADP